MIDRDTGTDPSPAEPEELRREIENTRRDLGDTVEALAHKADVKAHVHEHVEEQKESLRQPGARLAAGAIVALILLLVLRKRRR